MKCGVVSLIGRPNAGKSTLLNRVLGEKISSVTPKAQTTRDRIQGVLTLPEKGQMVLTDTPGLHLAKSGSINDYMVSEAERAMRECDLIWYLVDPDTKSKREELILELLDKVSCPVFTLLNKADLKRDQSEVLAKLNRENLSTPPNRCFSVSARYGQGVQSLLDASWELLPTSEHLLYPDPDQISDRPVRFLAGEFIREQVFCSLGDELPYSCAVEVQEFLEESEAPKIRARIWVERESQKPMVIGRGGHKIKEIGIKSRKEIEKLLGTKVHLGLDVGVLKNWSRDRTMLKRLGYHLPKEMRRSL